MNRTASDDLVEALWWFCMGLAPEKVSCNMGIDRHEVYRIFEGIRKVCALLLCLTGTHLVGREGCGAALDIMYVTKMKFTKSQI